MEEAMGPTYSQILLQKPVNSNGHLESRGQPDPHCNFRKRIIALGVTLAVVFSALITAIVLAVLPAKSSSADLGPPAGPACPDGWVGYQRKCHYFSETEGNWTYCRSNCSSLGAFLAGIDSEQELTFLLRYKGVHDHWIGLHREPGQPWKWTNGTAFNRLFLIGGGGDCAYLNYVNGVSSSRCSTERRWICSKPEAYVTGKGTALEGDLK
ncbi:C-type lectin domain family 2 member D-like [Emydura macquarii macquarii]|uniref:C-type lectin domain family 2 member D-like n=1 Tax=Emydura macquarii macquarii TaxID=1129001 RepID=UPI00352A9709